MEPGPENVFRALPEWLGCNASALARSFENHFLFLVMLQCLREFFPEIAC